jgi:hypothetical protein
LTSLPFVFTPRIIFTGARLFERKENNATTEYNERARTHFKTKFARTQIKYLLSAAVEMDYTERRRSPAGDRPQKHRRRVQTHRPLRCKNSRPLSVPINISSAEACM